MKVKCVDNINRTWRDKELAFTVGKVYEAIVDNEFINDIQLYVIDDNREEMTIASLGLNDWDKDKNCWYKYKWFMDHFKIVG